MTGCGILGDVDLVVLERSVRDASIGTTVAAYRRVRAVEEWIVLEVVLVVHVVVPWEVARIATHISHLLLELVEEIAVPWKHKSRPVDLIGVEDVCDCEVVPSVLRPPVDILWSL